ncbi:hypothetical protein A3F28_00210 [Candidatus Uhrbacteria bacterium RIFCSPHIGHO2_12_FULL_57_11]|uniref:Uncharacterized protein n=2 Tax=Candidatus Uhriibacteriota TaxID=1752732 RepID=A0A1F7UJR3_9BACT|nr:MAG: hypothetical protein A3D72_02540 [Candidatus Uhrbacteria bacterium RIFCSPHIGHO2_02_FULL_57_19]OGL77958.1 MAG: hypothetical protein A3F28_00210 [Candidatus Uhrbacteria bacterium RIFCSPHIGHO2_12_FULL_57_11]
MKSRLTFWFIGLLIIPFLSFGVLRWSPQPAAASPECQQGSKEGTGCDCWCLRSEAELVTIDQCNETDENEDGQCDDGAPAAIGDIEGEVKDGRLLYRRDGNCNSSTVCEQECDNLLAAGERSGSDSDCRSGALEPAAGAPASPQAPVNYQQGGVVIEIENPLGTTSIPALVGRVISAFLGIAGSLAILMVVYGGVTWLTSGGSPEKIEKGKKILVWAVIGLIVIFGAYSLVNFVLSRIIGL